MKKKRKKLTNAKKLKEMARIRQNRTKTPIEDIQKEIKGKYPFCDKTILNWLDYRIKNYLINNTRRI